VYTLFMDVALITCAEWPQLSPSDAVLQKALVARGIDAQPLAWNDPTVDWSLPRMSIIRATWDYFKQRDAFLDWARHVSQLHTLWNPFSLLQWNTHKSYLRDLGERGVPIIPTAWLKKGSSVNFEELLQDRGWTEVVIKPAISAEAYGTILITEGMAMEGQLYVDHMLTMHDMLIQPFLPAVLSSGERSIIVIDGEVTHALSRPPIHAVRPDGQQQADLPQKELVVPGEDELQLVRKVMDALPSPTLYARVDLVRDLDGLPRLMEVELVEPGLWMHWKPEAAERFADTIVKQMQNAKSVHA
jgi:hypothetical protein